MKAIAVARDLIDASLEGTYILGDEMAARWEHKIERFMGKNGERAREWGKRRVTIHRNNPAEP